MNNEAKDVFKVLYVVDGEGKAHEIKTIEDLETLPGTCSEDGFDLPSVSFEGSLNFVVDSEYAATDISDIKDEISAKLERIEHETYMSMYQLSACKNFRSKEEKEKFARGLNDIRVRENVKHLIELRDTIDDYVDYLSNLFFDEADAYISDPIELN